MIHVSGTWLHAERGGSTRRRRTRSASRRRCRRRTAARRAVVAVHDRVQLGALVDRGACWDSSNSTSAGCSCTHGTHFESKKLSTTQLPLRRDRSNVAPSSSSPIASGAGRPISGRARRTRFGVSSAPARTTNSAPHTTAIARRDERRRAAATRRWRRIVRHRGRRQTRTARPAQIGIAGSALRRSFTRATIDRRRDRRRSGGACASSGTRPATCRPPSSRRRSTATRRAA